MKFFLAMFFYALVALILCWGILLTIRGNPWVLIAAAAGYLLALIRIGCIQKEESH